MIIGKSNVAMLSVHEHLYNPSRAQLEAAFYEGHMFANSDPGAPIPWPFLPCIFDSSFGLEQAAVYFPHSVDCLRP